jgi:hypothetical protein
VSWTGAKELKAQLLRLWERGELLRELLAQPARFPLRLSLKGPNSADITERFDAVRAWSQALAATPAVRLEWQTVRHRVQGEQQLPASAWVDTLDDALRWLGKSRDAEAFAALVACTRPSLPALLPWLAKRPLQALALAPDWPRLVAVANWLLQHPQPGCYLRQVDLPGVHSKFIEAHRAVLAELLDLALPADAVNSAASGVSQFAARYGFLDKPARIRFRVLDPDLPTLPAVASPDITLDAANFGRLEWPVHRVFITENEINFLAFPPVHHAIVIFGAGYGWEALTGATWLSHCRVHYWGDIDTHGFAILNQLRATVPQAQSFLMDRETLQAHRLSWGVETSPSRVDLPRLTAQERALYDDLRDNRLERGLRLEQERIAFAWVIERLRAA